MKDYRKRYNVLVWMVIALVAVNVILIGALFFNPEKVKDENESTKTKAETKKSRHRGHDFLIKELELDKEQQLFYKNSKRRHEDEARQLMSEIRDCKKQLHCMMILPESDTNMAAAYMDTIASLSRQLEYVNFRHFNEMRKMLTEEQSKKFDKFTEEMHQRMEKRLNRQEHHKHERR